jgi:hypothetical protein
MPENATGCCTFSGLFFDGDALAVLLAGAFPGVTWRGFRRTLEQVVFLPAIQQHRQEG